MHAQPTQTVARALCTEGDAGQLETSLDLGGNFQFRTLPLERYGLQPIASRTQAFWLRTGDRRPVLVDYFTGEPVPEERRGKPLSYFVEQFRQHCPEGRLKALLSFGDCGVNKNRGMLTPDEIITPPCGLAQFGEPRSWLVCYKTGIIRAEQLCVEGVVQDRQCKPIRVRRAHSPNGTKDILAEIKWAIMGLPVIVAGRPDDEAVYLLDDDLRHPFATPAKDGLYVMEKALLKAREEGSSPREPLEVDLSLYGDLPTTFEILLQTGYWQTFRPPVRAGEFQIIAPNRILCRPRESGYGISLLGLCKDGALGSFICKAPPTDCGYIGPSVRDQIRMMVAFFSHAWILDEGLDPLIYSLSVGVPPWEFPVRGQPNGRLSAMICLYEP